MEPKSQLPPLGSLLLILSTNFLFNVSFFIIVPTATAYAKSLGGGSLFSGLTVGVVTGVSFFLVIPLSLVPVFRKRYRPMLHVSAACLISGHLIYSLAGQTGILWLILVGRMINGIGFTGWFFVKRYCTDPRIVGVQRRTMCTSLLVLAQTLGMVSGPILGGLLGKVPFNTRLFNKYTMPGWFMAAVWTVFWLLTAFMFKDVDDDIQAVQVEEGEQVEEALPTLALPLSEVTPQQRSRVPVILVSLLMSYSAFVTFFELGSWETSIPIYSGKRFGYDEFNAGNFIGLVGLGTLVVVGLMPSLARKMQDRVWLMLGFFIGFAGILLNFVLLVLGRHPWLIVYGGQWFMVCLGFNLASSITLSLLSKNLPPKSSDNAAIAVQLSNYTGRLTGAIWGTAAAKVGDWGVALGQLVAATVSILGIIVLWKFMAAQRG